MQHLYRHIQADPRFHALERKRRGFTSLLLAFLIGNEVWYILATAYYPKFGFARLWGEPIAAGYATTWGIVIGIAQTVLYIALVGIYTYRANGEFETLKNTVVQDALRAVGEKQ
jgi:uncharacterized membrane protein (DUF485 family)